ncbi:MAG: alginate lyase family protein [Candidatus Marinimicrobia bacterium]|nr:alginate lyase family protein [Candidatus Neomarinimicrobiota bacterium]
MIKTIHIVVFVSFLILGCSQDQEGKLPAHPSLSLSVSEAQEVVAGLEKYPLLASSYQELKGAADGAISADIEVPLPGEAGGYAHEKHKQNYRDMKNAGYLFTFTGDTAYAFFVKTMLDEYALLYPTLGPHPLSAKQKPGRLFHQVLNESVWLLNTAQAYDCVYEWLKPEDRQKYEDNIFNPMVELFSVKYAEAHDQIHNHGMWASASVGMIGLAMGNDEYVERAIFGTKNNGTGGFLAQVEHLFSPDGYYMEGAYYVRYAIRPLLFFAEALERNRPYMKIYEFKDEIIKKAFYSMVQMTSPSGEFFPINDASVSMNILAPGVLYGTSVIFDRYGFDKNLLGLAKIQGEVYPNGAGLKLAQAYAQEPEVTEPSWSSIEFVDGDDGTHGGFGILRSGEGKDQTVLAMKYGGHGLGHGHFDKLHFMFYDGGEDVVPDYGYARWVNIETKYGGRYLPENNSYAKQTIAHNTLVIDGKSQNDGNRKAADKVHASRHFFDVSNPEIQVMSATTDVHYDGTSLQRTMLLIEDQRLEYPVVLDIYRVESEKKHQYDMPIHYKGYIMNTNFEYAGDSQVQKPLGTSSGYEHIWKTAGATVTSDAMITWLDGHRYYSYITDVPSKSEILFGMTGANDPNFNLRNEPVFITRTSGKDMVFASILEPHGYYSLAEESSISVHPTIQELRVVGHSDEGTVVEVLGAKDLHWTIMINNAVADADAEHTVDFSGETYSWKGNFKVIQK